MIRKRVRTPFHMAVSFAVTVLVAVVVLKLLNWVPSLIQKEDLRKYARLEDVKSSLRLDRLYIPAYFPEYIQWPPFEIFGQRRPFTMIMMNFKHRETGGAVLSLYQVDAGVHFEPPYKSDIVYVRQERTVEIGGRKASLMLAVCGNRERCNRLTVQDGRYRIILIADDTPEQLLKMGESIL